MGKQFLTYEQQVFNLTQNKGLIIDDEEKAISVLKSNNYIRLHIYFQQFSENNRFIEGTTLDQILSAYEQDRSLRRLVSYYLETIEIKARSLVGHELGRAYGPDAFYDCSNFKNAVEWEKLIINLRMLQFVMKVMQLKIILEIALMGNQRYGLLWSIYLLEIYHAYLGYVIQEFKH